MKKIFLIFALITSALIAQTIQPGQGVKITISGVPSEEAGIINNIATYPVSETGNVRLHLIEDVNIAGLSPSAAAKKIESVYKAKQIYTFPTIQIVSDMIGGSVSQQNISVLGAVAKPSQYPLTPNLTLYQAIALAGDVNMFADKSKIKLMRGNAQKVYDLNNPVDRNIKLQANDSIEVKERGWLPKFGN